MGCTAHVHIELKRGDKWLHFSAPNVRRDYAIFALIAGVRSDSFYRKLYGKYPIAKIHEMPQDVSEVTKICYEQDAKLYRLHDISVLTAEDLQELQESLKHLVNYDLEENVFRTYVNSGSIAAHRGWDDVRVILWFDN